MDEKLITSNYEFPFIRSKSAKWHQNVNMRMVYKRLAPGIIPISELYLLFRLYYYSDLSDLIASKSLILAEISE